jgi:hypothetical protein
MHSKKCPLALAPDNGSLILSDHKFSEKYCDSETMLQNYLARRMKKKQEIERVYENVE